MTTLVMVLHILGCLCLILVVLLQSGKGASMGAAFGGSSQTVFGSAGAMGFLGKVTTGVAILFMITSLALAVFSSPKLPTSVMDNAAVPASPPAQTQEAQPAQQLPPPAATLPPLPGPASAPAGDK